MNVCENEAVIAFDTLYTQNHIQILKILLPYFDPYGQSHLAVWIKYLELRYTLEYVSRHPSPPYKNQTSGTSSPDFAVLFEQIQKLLFSPGKSTVWRTSQPAEKSRAVRGNERDDAAVRNVEGKCARRRCRYCGKYRLFRHESGCRLY